MSTKGYFEGRYYKQQTRDGHILALIPGRSDDNAFIQVLTEQESYNIVYDIKEYHRKGEQIRVGGSVFSPSGIHLNIHSNRLTLTGSLRYQNLSPLRSDIMGPFRFFPMECRHGIHSMLHQTDGEVLLNSKVLDFTNGKGYIESDSGSSFPSAYMWLQCNDFAEKCSIMASVARIPLAGFHFWGCISVVWLHGREYRLATYYGAKILRLDPNRLTLKQGRLTLDVEMGNAGGHALYAPRSGTMNRTIHESVACPAHFRFCLSSRVLFEASSLRASYEYDIPRG